jgi:hypothetical protein
MSIASRVFSMHRSNEIRFIDFTQRKNFCNIKNNHDLLESPLHFAAGAAVLEAEAEAENNNKHGTSSNWIYDEVEAVKTVLWLLENGADINALTKDKRTPLKIALQGKKFTLAKHLLDRGALTTGLNPEELEQVQKLKALLAKNAISSVSCSPCLSSSSSSSSSFALNALKAFPLTTKVSENNHTNNARLLFLQKQPGLIRNSSYVSVFVEQIGISNPSYLSRPRILISVLGKFHFISYTFHITKSLLTYNV